jgi:hypothetical protein
MANSSSTGKRIPKTAQFSRVDNHGIGKLVMWGWVLPSVAG